MSVSRRLGAAAAVGTAVLGLVAAGAALPAQAAPAPAGAVTADAGTPPAGPFEPGNLLDFAESDFEGSAGTGGWISVSNATLSQSTTQAYLHDDSLQDTIGTAGTSVYKVGGDTEIAVNGNDTYTVGGYFEVPAASGRTVTWKLGFYNDKGAWLGWGATPAISLNPSGTWQYAAGTITAPSTATYVLDSPEVSYAGASAGETIYMDEVAFSPYRAAQMIGAYAGPYGSASDWVAANQTSEIGPLQSNKEFYSLTNTLPTTFAGTTCAQIASQVTPPPACVITYKNAEAQDGITTFVKSIPSDQTVILVFCQEPEGKGHGASCNLPQSGSAFQAAFEQQSDEIRAAGDYPNVLVGMDAEDDEYDAGGTNDNGGSPATTCYYIPPASYVDVYLVDHYENVDTAADNGLDMPNAGGISATEWDTWLGCVSGLGKPIGLAEYGLNQNLDTPAPPATNSQDVIQSMGADNTYLEQLPATLTEPVLLWENWWAGGDQFTDSASEAKWQSFETQNGGT